MTLLVEKEEWRVLLLGHDSSPGTDPNVEGRPETGPVGQQVEIESPCRNCFRNRDKPLEEGEREGLF